MLNVSSNEISLTKGDSALISITLKTPDGSDILPRAGDKVCFSLRHPRIGGVIFAKEGTLIELTPTDTNLPAGKYLYDVVLKSNSGEVCTVIPPTVFEIRKAVHQI